MLLLAVLLTVADAPSSLKADLTFLTRDGCVNTPDMVNNLDDALTALRWPKDYAYVNIGTLRTTDVRTGYPTPTLLWRARTSSECPLRSHRSTRRVDASTRTEFRPTK